MAALVANHTAGSPVDETIRWTNRSSREIARELAHDGLEACADTVRTILREALRLGLRQAVKDESTRVFPQRNEQFEHIVCKTVALAASPKLVQRLKSHHAENVLCICKTNP